jgi:membrane-associated phospholipid phosphatase
MVFLVPKNTLKKLWSNYQQIIHAQSFFLFLIFLILGIHLIEVNFIDSYITKLIGYDFTTVFQSIEDGFVYWFSQHWNPVLLTFFVFIYIVLYPFTLWFSLLYFLIVNERKAMKTFAYSLVIIYTITVPFYLFFPVTNVNVYHGATSALNTIIPGVEQFFYTTTTNNNCFPSLHVALALLIAKTVSCTNNKRFIYLAYFSAICVICSVVYLAIHWIIDVIGGILLAFIVFYLVERFTKET